MSTAKVYKTESGQSVYGLMAEFKTPADTSHAAEKIRDAGFRKWDVYSPFPIHGIEEAMGLPATKLPLVVAAVGLSMACAGFAFQYFVRAIDYPLVHQGKPPGAWQLLVPVTFEIGVLFTAFTSLLGMLAFNALPRWHHPLMAKERFLKTSDDRFIIAVEAADPKFNPEVTRKLLTDAGATSVEIVED